MSADDRGKVWMRGLSFVALFALVIWCRDPFGQGLAGGALVGLAVWNFFST